MMIFSRLYIYKLGISVGHSLHVQTRDAEYSQFHLEDESDSYRLRFASFKQASAGDALIHLSVLIRG